MKSENPIKKLSTLKALKQFLLPYKKTLLGAGIALVFTAGITLSIGQGVRLVIDQGFASQSTQQLNQAVLILIVLVTLMSLGTFIRFYLVSWLGERVSSDIRKKVFDHLLTLHPSYFEVNRSGEIMSRLTTDTTLLQTIIGSSFSMALRSALMFVGALLMLLFTNWKLTLIVLFCVPLVLLPIILYGRKVRVLARRSQDSIADVGTYAGEIIQHIKTVQSYHREDEEIIAFSGEVEKAFTIAKKRVQQRAILMAIVILLVFGAIAGMLWTGGHDVLSGQMSGGELGAFLFYAIMIATSVATISEVYGELQRAAGATDRLMELINVESLITPPKNNNIDHLPQEQAQEDNTAGEIILNNVSFSYPSRPDEPAIKNLSLSINKGECVALVGPSGAGKSTIFELLQRFYDPQAGEILLNGINVKNMNPVDLRKHMALVPQQPALFTNDVAYNIRYGKPNATDDEVIAAAKAAHAHEFIEKLPNGYKSELGEQGVRLSGGQRQRIAIARAILKNPKILLLDEATSALDAQSEEHVQKALETVMQNRTTLIIAHRFSTILHADKIAVIENGQINSIGTHQELLLSSPLYKDLAALQFKQSKRDATMM